ncbi:MAG: PASTA domain-containing protein [Methanosarcinales archaeon]|nr:PASTA domain-containing protein [Methanosarcinales archaeon]
MLNLIELLKGPIISAVVVGVAAGLITQVVMGILKKLSKMIRERVNIKTWKLAAIISIIFIIIGLVYVFGPYKDQNISQMPDLTDLSKDMAAARLEEAGLRPEFKERFNCTIERNYIIPGTQDPKAGTYIQKNSSVKVAISLGGIPNVIGMEEEEAIQTLKDVKLNATIVEGRDSSVEEDHVFQQDPAGCDAVTAGSKIKLSVNRAISVLVQSPLDGEDIYSPVALEGKINVPLLEKEHLWIVVNPREALMNYYPQSGSPLTPREDLSFTGNAYLGAGLEGDIGKRYDILVLVVGDDLNAVIEEYMDYARINSDWRSITDWTSSSGRTVSQEEIVKSIKARVSDVGLKDYR